MKKKDSNELIGTCLVYYNDEEGEKHWDISYNLGAKYWGNGFITEAMKCAMQFANEKIGVCEYITTYAAANTASRRVLEKLGFEFVCRELYLYCNEELKTDGIRVIWTNQK